MLRDSDLTSGAASKEGNYKVKIKINATGNKNYKFGMNTATFKVIIK